jgi:hypothetical protein
LKCDLIGTLNALELNKGRKNNNRGFSRGPGALDAVSTERLVGLVRRVIEPRSLT